jgi:hypothetical protein
VILGNMDTLEILHVTRITIFRLKDGKNLSRLLEPRSWNMIPDPMEIHNVYFIITNEREKKPSTSVTKSIMSHDCASIRPCTTNCTQYEKRQMFRE